MEKQKAIMEQMKKDLENCAEYEKLISVCVENDDMEMYCALHLEEYSIDKDYHSVTVTGDNIDHLTLPFDVQSKKIKYIEDEHDYMVDTDHGKYHLSIIE